MDFAFRENPILFSRTYFAPNSIPCRLWPPGTYCTFNFLLFYYLVAMLTSDLHLPTTTWPQCPLPRGRSCISIALICPLPRGRSCTSIAVICPPPRGRGRGVDAIVSSGQRENHTPHMAASIQRGEGNLVLCLVSFPCVTQAKCLIQRFVLFQLPFLW